MQIFQISQQLNARGRGAKIIGHRHDTALRDLTPGSRYFFGIRDPISRFRSGFYSRQRRGQPRFNIEWTADERRTFGDFEHANDLAESLFAPGAPGRKAYGAMKSIRHTTQNQSDWFSFCGYFLETWPPVWIIRQEKFAADLAFFLQRSGLGVEINEVAISGDRSVAHVNDYSSVPALSETAVGNLKRWYAQDFALYAMCEEWLSDQEGAGRPASRRHQG